MAVIHPIPSRVRVIIPPIVASVDGAVVHILEASKYTWLDGTVRYIVTMYIECCGSRSDVFALDVASNRELVEKIKTEIAKIRLLLIGGEKIPPNG